MYLMSYFRDRTALIRALRELKANGFDQADLDLFSNEPVELPRGVLDRPSGMSLTVVTGAITICLLAIGFVHFTQYNYRLDTGGMPLFSLWATGVVFYELTMFGAIATTLLCFLWESGLPRRDRRLPIPAVEPGFICVRLRCRPEQADAAILLLKNAGADNTERVERA